MPAGSEPSRAAPDLPALPWRVRPFGVRIAAIILGGLLFGTGLGIWLAFPPEVQATFTLLQRVTVGIFAGAALACGHALARSRVDASEDGLLVVNGYRARRLEWAQVVSLSLKQGSPWASMDLDDGSTVPVMAIQGSDGDRAVRQVRRLRGLVAARTRTDRND